MFPVSFVEGLARTVKVVAFASYIKQDDDELTMNIGDVITVVQTYEGRIEATVFVFFSRSLSDRFD
jgi:hypothetical protein